MNKEDLDKTLEHFHVKHTYSKKEFNFVLDTIDCNYTSLK